jgi:hypothetical protein
MACKTVQSIDELIAAFGSVKATSDALGATPQKIVNWRDREGSLPARLYLKHQDILAAHEIYAPPSLWGFEQAAAE